MRARMFAVAVLLCASCTDAPAAAPPRVQATGPVPVSLDDADASTPAALGPAAAGPVAALVRTSCARLLQAVPDQLGGGALARRPVTSDPRRTAAWGDPPILMQCGVAPPERLSEPVKVGPPDREELVRFNVRDIGAGYLYTTVGRSVNVSVQLPDDYDVPYVAPLTGPILDTLPSSRPSTQPTPP